MKQKITTRLLATLLLTAGSLATIPLMTTALTSCTADELIEMQLPPAPSNPQLKPGEVTISLNVPAPAGFNEAGTRAIGEATGDPDPGKTTWTEGDELMMNLAIIGYETEEGPSYTYHIFTTATCTKGGGSDAQWKLSSTPSAIYSVRYQGNTPTAAAMPTTFNPFGTDGQFTLPAELEQCTTMTVTLGTTYAPDAEWATTVGKDGGTIVSALSQPSADATGTREQWNLSHITNSMSNGEALQPILPSDNANAANNKRAANAALLATLFTFDLSKDMSGSANAFKPQACGRLRIATFPGATVQIASNRFYPTAAQRTELNAEGDKFVDAAVTPDANGLNLYTTTADAKGNAYFYGLVGKALVPDNMENIDGTAGYEFIVSAADEIIFQATAKAPVSLATGMSVKIDGNTTLIESGKVFAVNVTECTDGANLINKLEDAYNGGSTMWKVTGNVGDRWSGGEVIGFNAQITSAISSAMNEIHANNPDAARISLLLPTITSLGAGAFSVSNQYQGALLLQSITAPAAANISSNAFQGCKALTSINLPAVTSIGERAFLDCKALTSINLPAVTGDIGQYAFSNCVALTSINLPAVTGSIGGTAFYGCASLTNINLPGATSIAASAFAGCAELTSIELPGATSIGDLAFANCAKLTNIILPKVTIIGMQAFSNCVVLASISLPELTSIGKQAFNSCTALTTLSFGSIIATCGSNIMMYSNNPGNITLTLAAGQKNFKKDGTALETEVEIGTGKDFAGYTFKEIKTVTP